MSTVAQLQGLLSGAPAPHAASHAPNGSDPLTGYAQTDGEKNFWPLRADGVDRAGTDNLLFTPPPDSAATFFGPNGTVFSGVYGEGYRFSPWIWPESFTLCFRYTPTHEGTTEVFIAQYNDDPDSVFQVYRLGDSVYVADSVFAADVLSAGTEIFIAVTMTGRVPTEDPEIFESTASIFINGSLAMTDTLPYRWGYPPILPLSIGSNSGGNYPVSGTIRDVRIFDRVLSSDEILALNNKQ